MFQAMKNYWWLLLLRGIVAACLATAIQVIASYWA